MAIYHFSVSTISRGKGQSSVASASYRSGEKLKDERTNETKYYHREVKPETMILSPSNSPSWVTDRERLWNEVEKSETRKNSRVAREINIALPVELTNEQQKELIKNYVQEQFVDKGMIADVAIHRDDIENPHAHVMLTTREISKDGFTTKNRDWDRKELLELWREEWSKHTNKSLELNGSKERITHLSHEARGLETLPTVHLGHVASQIEKEGKRSERGDINRERQEYNQTVISLEKYREEKRQLEKEKAKDFTTTEEKIAIKKAVPVVKSYVTLDSIKDRKQSINGWELKNNRVKNHYVMKEQEFNKVNEHFKRQDYIQKQIAQHNTKIEELKTFNIFKIKANNAQKERLTQDIKNLKQDFSYHERAIQDSREKLGFTTYEDFKEKYSSFSQEKQTKLASYEKQNQEIQEQRSILSEAEKALKESKIREVTSLFPDLQELNKPIDYGLALELDKFAKSKGKGGSIAELKDDVSKLEQKYNKDQRSYSLYNAMVKNLDEATSYYRKVHSTLEEIKRIDNNPLEQGRKSSKTKFHNQYESLKEDISHYQDQLKTLGYDNFDRYEKDLNTVKTVQNKVPEIEQNLDNQRNEIDLFSSVISAIEHAQQAEQAKEKKHGLTRAKGRKKQQDQGLELGG